MTMGLETAITSRAAAVVAAASGRPGPAAHTARAWIDSMTPARNYAQNAACATRGPRNSMSGDRLMHTTARLAASSITALLAAAALAAPAPSNAALTTISPGDQVDYISPNANTQFCTIGYVYSGPDFS
jgi:hypothetical protein